MRIGQLAQLVGVETQTIRFYEQQGLLPPPDRQDNGYRVYTEKHGEGLAFIRRCRILGLSLAEIHELQSYQDDPHQPCTAVNTLLDDHISHVRSQISLRHYWGLGEKPVKNMIKLIEAKGVRVFSLAENTKNVDAFSCWRNGTPYIFLNTFKSAERSRMDAAHEIGHLVLHKHGGPQHKQAEYEANTFASAFLMPEADIKSKIPYVRSLEQLLPAKKRWGVSISALVYRLHKMNILTDWQSRNFYIEINQRGFRTNEPDGMEHEESVIWQKVFNELWHDRITKNNIADELNIPFDEIENLVFGLSRFAHIKADRSSSTKLSIV